MGSVGRQISKTHIQMGRPPGKHALYELRILPFSSVISPCDPLFLLQPLSMTYDHDLLCTRQPPLRPSQVLSVPQSRGARQRSVGGAVDARLRQNRSSEGLQPILSTTDCNVSVFIAMPSPHEYFSAESGQEFVIGTADVMYRHPERPHS